MKNKSIYGLLLCLLMVSCGQETGSSFISTSSSSTSSSLSNSVSSSTIEKEREATWKEEPVISSYLGEKLTFLSYGKVEIIEVNDTRKEVILEKENYVNLEDIDYYSSKKQTLKVSVENLSLTYDFILKAKEDHLTSVELVSLMGVGYNLGDTFESDIGNYFEGATPSYAKKIYEELGYTFDENGNPDELFCEVRQHYTPYRGKTTAKTIQAIYEKGFRSIRLPVAWSNHMEDDVISSRWMNRIQEVIDACMKYKDLYVILTLMEPPSFSGYWLEDAYKEQTTNLIRNVWTQVASTFKNYDYRLIFENLNEPLHKTYQWQMTSIMETKPEVYREVNENLMNYNQLFVDTVRKEGSKNNRNRFLTVNTYGNIAYLAYDEKIKEISPFAFPKDTIEDHLLFNVHGYTPNDFSFGRSDTYDKSSVTNLMENLYQNYVQKGIGVIMSEWGAVHGEESNTQREETRKEYYGFFIKEATTRQIGVMMWDNTAIRDSWKEGFGFLNRHKAAGIYADMKNISGTAYDNETLWFYEDVLDSMFQSYKENKKR